MVPCSLYLGAPVAFFAFFARLAKVDLVRAAARVQSLARYKVPLGHRPVRGSYLVSCVFYGVLTGRPSVGLPYIPGEIGAEARVYLQPRSLRLDRRGCSAAASAWARLRSWGCRRGA